MRIPPFALGFTLVLVAAAACGGQTVDLGGTSGRDGGHDGTVDGFPNVPDVPEPACVPASQTACACPGGKFTGVQSCNADGRGYGGCHIGVPNPAAGTDAGEDAAVKRRGDAGAGATCSATDECAAPAACNVLPGQDKGTCGTGCASDADCPRYLVCNAGSCGSSVCPKCPIGQTCNPSQTGPSSCVPCGLESLGCNGCVANSDCGEGKVCRDGGCHGCMTDAECGPTATCNADHSSTYCTCKTDADCAANEVCGGSHQCKAACCSNSDCPRYEVCIEGACQGCMRASDCGPASTCVFGVYPAQACECTTSADCQPGLGCTNDVNLDEVRGNRTLLCEVCSSAGNGPYCPIGQACVAGVCGACATTSDCYGTATGTSDEVGQSVPTTNGYVCIAGVCTHCTTNSQCGGGQACVNGTCGTCAIDAQCGPSGVCSHGFCTCTSDAQCDTGQRCGAGVCVSM